MLEVCATPIRLRPDPSRVIARPFFSHTAGLPDYPQRLVDIAARVAEQSPTEAEAQLEELRLHFGDRHRDLEGIWRRHLGMVRAVEPGVGRGASPSVELLIGAAFTQEYGIEGSALTNPSMVPLDGDEFLLSLRAIGEGHISSIEFRTGRVTEAEVEIDPPARFATPGTKRVDHLHNSTEFAQKLDQMDASDDLATSVIELLPARFSTAQMETALSQALAEVSSQSQADSVRHMFRWLASSNYALVFDGQPVSERVLFPAGPLDSHGMEDARFVRFRDDDGSFTYFATYTAFDGAHILPQIIETKDFLNFEVSSLHGAAAQNKGMAIFPRKVDGHYLALSRHDQINLHVLTTDDVWQWDESESLTGPAASWEPVQIGNCGSPIETDEGWLVITHGVGPMRVYRLGALLLDLDHPAKIIGRLEDPLLSPQWDDRDGYVPNVVYSCGAMRWRDELILPYGINDQEVGVVRIEINSLLQAMS